MRHSPAGRTARQRGPVPFSPALHACQALLPHPLGQLAPTPRLQCPGPEGEQKHPSGQMETRPAGEMEWGVGARAEWVTVTTSCSVEPGLCPVQIRPW